MDSDTEIPEPDFGEVIYISKGEFLTRGGTAILERLPSGDVIKTPPPNPYIPIEERDARRNMRLEAQVYERIGEHPRIPKFVEWDPSTCCLTMEYLANGNSRDYIKENQGLLSPALRHKWAKQAAEGLHVLHSFDIIHCDVSPRNFLLDCDLNLKISDFAGSSLSVSALSAFSNTRYRHPACDWDTPPRFEDGVFGLGSLIYFIMTDNYPYEEVGSDDVEDLYRRSQFLDVAHIPCGDIIEQCWHQQLDASQVRDYLGMVPAREGSSTMLLNTKEGKYRLGSSKPLSQRHIQA